MLSDDSSCSYNDQFLCSLIKNTIIRNFDDIIFVTLRRKNSAVILKFSISTFIFYTDKKYGYPIAIHTPPQVT